MKCRITGCAVVLTGLAIAGCSQQGPEGTTAPAPSAAGGLHGTIGLSVSTLSNPFFVALRDGAEAEARADDLKLLVVDSQNDPAKQIAGVEDLLQKKVSVILINPTDSDAVANVVKEATAAGVKVVSLDRAVNGAEVSSHVASDNVEGGRMAAQFLITRLGGKGNVVELEGIPGSSAARERGEGFDAAIASAPGIKVTARLPADFDRAKGLSVMENILQGSRNVQGVFAQNDEMALGAQKAVAEAGLKGVAIVGFDATPDGKAAVQAGELAATIQQKPELIGKLGVQEALLLIQGKPAQSKVPVPLDLISH
jgi:ribose transport system substrate-binding protein